MREEQHMKNNEVQSSIKKETETASKQADVELCVWCFSLEPGNFKIHE